MVIVKDHRSIVGKCQKFYCKILLYMIKFECGDRFKGTGDRFLKGDLLPFL